MAEVTRVPIKPVSKGSLLMLFAGIVIGIAIAAAFAWATAPKGLDVDVIRAGTGANPKASDVVFVRYVGKLQDGKEFDRGDELPGPVPPQIRAMLPGGVPMQLSGVVPGFRDAVLQMQKGGKYEVFIPSELAYGPAGNINPQTGEGVPANADLTFEIELVDFMSEQDAQQRFMAAQQMMQQMQGAAPGGEGAPPQGAAPPPAQ